MHCTRCGADVEAQYRFCPQCGLRLSEARETTPLAGERKLVTVLFCDLTGSTALAEQLDAEDYSDLLDEYIQRAFAEVYRFDGYVNQLAGDGFMAMFGAPVAHEDAPERAVRAALAVQRALADMAERRTPIRARIGIHTGPVVVGTVGTDRRMDYTAIGDTTNLAARLEQAALPGTILMSDATHRLVQGRFRVEATAPLHLKGKAEAVAAFRVLEESGVVGAIELAAARGLTPFVGRARELAQLEDALARATTGRRQIVAIAGPAGSGKSRLVYEFQRRHDGGSLTFFEGRCAAIEQATPFHPFVQMFRRHFNIRPGDTVDDAVQRVWCHEHEVHGEEMAPSEVNRMLTGFLVDPTRVPTTDVAADEVKRLVFDTVEHGIRIHAESGPVVIVVEDYHFIDEVSRELVEHLARQLIDHPVLLLVTHRPLEAMDAPKRGIMPIVLERLPDHDVTEIVRAAAGASLPGDLEDRLVRRAAGSPFFAEELVRALVESGALVVRDGRATAARPIEEMPIPDTVQEVIAARLDRLAPPVKRVVQVAAVLGRDVQPELLAQVLDGEQIDVADALGALERRGLLHRKGVGEATLRFGESLTQEIAYESLLVKQRRLLHERVATVLESRGSGQEVLLAYHYGRSENRPKAVAALLAAGGAAERVPAYDVAARLYRQAWDLGEAELAATPSPEMERAVYTALSTLIRFLAMFGLGDVALGERMAQRARELAARLGEEHTAPTLAYFEAVIVMMQGRAHYPRGLAQAEEAFASAQRLGSLPTMLNVARGLCLTYIVDGRLDLARRTVDWIIAEATRMSPPERPSDFQLAVEWLLAVVLYAADDLEGSLRQARATYARAIQFENRTLQCVSASSLGQVHLLQGSYAEAEEWSDLGLTLAERMGNLTAFVPSASAALVARHRLGRAVDPGPYVDLIERGLRSSGPAQVSFRFAPEALLLPGTPPARADELIRHMYALAGGRLREAIAAIGLATALRVHDPSSAEAERLYHSALAQAEAVGVQSVAAEAAIGLAELLLARGDRNGAAREAARAQSTIGRLNLGHLARRLHPFHGDDRAAQAGA